METAYKKLNMTKLKFRKHRTISTYEALKDVTPIEWKDTVYTGEEKVIINRQGINYVQNR